MKFTKRNNKLSVSDIRELCASQSSVIRDEVHSHIAPDTDTLEFDLSATNFLDSGGLGLLISFHKHMAIKRGQCIIVDPSPIVLQVLELTRLHKVFEIQRSSGRHHANSSLPAN